MHLVTVGVTRTQLSKAKSQLKHAKSFRADSKEIQDQLLQQVEQSSFLEQESKKLKDEMAMQISQIASVEGLLEQTEQENEELKSLLKQSTSKSVISESQPAQGSAPSDRERQYKKSKEEGSPKLKARVAALKVNVKERDETIANLTRQLHSFTQTAEEFARIQKHSKNKQSQVVADLKGQLEQREKTEIDLTTSLMVSQEEIKELKSQQTNFDSTVRKLHIKKAELQQQVKTLSERGQEFATTKYQKTECPRQQLEKIVTELQSTVETLQDEKKGLVEILRKMSVLEERRDHLEQVVVNQQAVIANDRQALQDSQARATELAKDKDDLENQLVRIMKEKTEILSEVEVHKFAYQNQISALRNQTDGLREQVANVEDEVQSRTQQGRQYKKMIDSYKDELAVSREQATEQKIQIKMFALEAERYKKLNEALCHEIENLKARQRHKTAIHGGSSTRGRVPAAELQKERTRREEVEKGCLKLEKMYDDLAVKLVMLTSENDQYKKQLGLQRDQSSQSSAAAGAYNPNIQRGGLTTAGGQGRLGQSEKMYKQSRSAIEHLQEQIKWLNKTLLHWYQTLEVVQSSRDKLQPFVIQEPFQLGTKVGGGSYGAVYSSTIGTDNGIRCIAKRILDILVGRDGHEGVSEKYKSTILSNFQCECTILSTARHPNIVQFIGVHYGSDQYDIRLIMEHLPTDLEKLLAYCEENEHGFKLPLSFQVSFLSDISSGLLYLHNQSIVHRDLNSGNILLTADLQAKIADLGVSKLHQDRKWFQKLTKAPGASGYMPPEALREKPDYDEKIDIFSFGVLSLYIASQKYPEVFEEHVPDRIHHKGEGEIHKRRQWVNPLKTQRHPFYDLVRQCLLEKRKRPNTTEVVKIVRRMHDTQVCTIEETLSVFAHFHDLLKRKT